MAQVLGSFGSVHLSEMARVRIPPLSSAGSNYFSMVSFLLMKYKVVITRICKYAYNRDENQRSSGEAKAR